MLSELEVFEGFPGLDPGTKKVVEGRDLSFEPANKKNSDYKRK